MEGNDDYYNDRWIDLTHETSVGADRRACTVGYLLQSTSCYNPLSVIIQLKTEIGKGVPLVFSLKMAFQNMSPVTIHWIVTGSPL